MEPRITVREIVVHERPINLRLPFRFGATTLRQCPQAFVRVRIRVDGSGDATGCAAEAIAPRWFDKSPALSEAASLEQLRTALRIAASAYVSAGPATAFGLFRDRYADQIAEGGRLGLPPLAAGYGQALLDRAVFDAVCRTCGVGFLAGTRRNLAGLSTELAPDLAGFDIARFLATRIALPQVAARHTVGLLDPLTAADQEPGGRVNDGLPETLEDAVETYGVRHFKIKIGGDIGADHERLARVASCLDRIDGAYLVTIDGNEQYANAEDVLALLVRLEEDPAPAVARLLAATAYIEQPIGRDASTEIPIDRVAARMPVIIDEADGTLDAFPRHRRLGYSGVSSKTCKGFYKSILNAARCRVWSRADGRRYFMSGEDLACQAGLAVQQDLVLASSLGLAHVERNGHHYVHGMSAASADEQAGFRERFPDLYENRAGTVCLRIRDGMISTASLHASTGWASAVEPDWSRMPVTMTFAA